MENSVRASIPFGGQKKRFKDYRQTAEAQRKHAVRKARENSANTAAPTHSCSTCGLGLASLAIYRPTAASLQSKVMVIFGFFSKEEQHKWYSD